jgi:hypothetical protein
MVLPRTADAHFLLYLSLRDAVPPSLRPALEDLWTGVSGSMDDLDLQILEMRANASEYPASTAERPGTSSTVAAQRREEEEGLLLTGPLNPNPSVVVARIWDLDADWTMRYLLALRDPVASRNELDCWASRLRSGHPNGYVKVNLRNTRRPGAPRDVVVGCQPYVHQLAVVARGGGAALLNAGHEAPSVRKSADRRHLTSATVRGA